MFMVNYNLYIQICRDVILHTRMITFHMRTLWMKLRMRRKLMSDKILDVLSLYTTFFVRKIIIKYIKILVELFFFFQTTNAYSTQRALHTSDTQDITVPLWCDMNYNMKFYKRHSTKVNVNYDFSRYMYSYIPLLCE